LVVPADEIYPQFEQQDYYRLQLPQSTWNMTS